MVTIQKVFLIFQTIDQNSHDCLQIFYAYVGIFQTGYSTSRLVDIYKNNLLLVSTMRRVGVLMKTLVQ